MEIKRILCDDGGCSYLTPPTNPKFRWFTLINGFLSLRITNTHGIPLIVRLTESVN